MKKKTELGFVLGWSYQLNHTSERLSGGKCPYYGFDSFHRLTAAMDMCGGIGLRLLSYPLWIFNSVCSCVNVTGFFLLIYF